jgi:phosphopantetheine--protein transferase-like protein
MAEVSVLVLGDWLENDVLPYLGFASSERQAAVARFRFASDKNRSLWAELFARWRLAEATGLSPAEIEISHDEKGKPFCKSPPLSVSLSHSGPFIAVAVGKSAVGIDVERKRKISLAVSRRWFRPEEHEFLTSLPEEERARAFFRFWTLKEAALKYTGEGLAGGPETVNCFALLDAEEKEDAEALAGRNFPLPREATVGVVAARKELPDKARIFIIERGENGIYGDAIFTKQDAITS